MKRKIEWSPTPTRQGKYIKNKINLNLLYNLYKYRKSFSEEDRRFFDGYFRELYENTQELCENNKDYIKILDGLCRNDIKDLTEYYKTLGWQKPLKDK